MPHTPLTRDRTLAVLLAVLGLLVVTALAVVFLRPSPALRGAGTPEGVVQRYAAAVIDGDRRAAAGYLIEAPERCRGWEGDVEENLRVSLVSTDLRGGAAEVEVSVVSFDPGGPFGSSEFETEETFELKKTGGSWLIDTVPWRLQTCSSGPAS
jgi:hypothetical protein